MPKPDQTLRVILRRGNDCRALLNVWRTGEDFFSTVPGEKGHRSYHERGRTHTKSQVNGENIYHDIRETGVPPRALQGSALMHLLALRNERSWHSQLTPFDPYSGKKADVLLEIDSLSIPPGRVVNVLAGLVEKGRHDLVDAHVHQLCSDGNMEFTRATLDTPWCVIFCIVVHETAGAHLDWTSRNPSPSLFADQPAAACQIRTHTITPQNRFAFAAAGGFIYDEGLTTMYTTRKFIKGWVMAFRPTVPGRETGITS